VVIRETPVAKLPHAFLKRSELDKRKPPDHLYFSLLDYGKHRDYIKPNTNFLQREKFEIKFPY
jgi:hypothetical protein